jgi:hypothetical protein
LEARKLGKRGSPSGLFYTPAAEKMEAGKLGSQEAGKIKIARG